MREIKRMREELKHKAEREAMKLWRLARRAEKHGVAAEIVRTIRDEADYCHRTLTAYPERVLSWRIEYDTKYAFR